MSRATTRAYSGRGRRHERRTFFSSAAVSFVPSDLPNLALWLKADAITGLADGAAVATWNDSSSNARNATQATGGAQPIYRTALLNGKPVVRFDGVDDFLATGEFQQTEQWTAFAVALKAPGVDTPTVASTAKAVTPHGKLIRFNGDVEVMSFAYNVAGASTSDSQDALPTSFLIVSALRTTSAIQVWADGISAGETVALGTPASPVARVVVGADDGVAVGNFLNGDIAEVVYYSSPLSTTDRDKVEAYLGDKYGLPH